MPGELKEISPIVVPAVTPLQAKQAWNQYQELKKAVQTKDDIQIIQGKNFLKKSYWRKLATYFNLSVEIVEESKEEVKDCPEAGDMIFNFRARATAPNGRFAEGTGSCNLLEKGRKNTIHNTRTTAETRAWNRAVSNLVGGGEVSAEEVDSDGYGQKNATQGHTEASAEEPVSVKQENIGKPASNAQIQAIYTILAKKLGNKPREEVNAGILETYKVDMTKITMGQASDLITALQGE